ncbi:MAG: carboxypeptidase M32 [Candidatus Promineifilaceae bacterium]
MSAYQTFLAKVTEVNDLQKAIQLASWDRETNMPRAASADRTHMLTTLSRLVYQLASSDEFGQQIEDAKAEIGDCDPDSTEVRLVDFVAESYERGRSLSADYVQRSAAASGAARDAWIKARSENDFAHFQPHLETVVELCQEKAELYGYEDEAYNALLHDFEKGMTAAEIRRLFDTVKAATVPLLQAIVERGTTVDDSILHQSFPIEKQKAFARNIASVVGYDLERGHLSTVIHPFATSFSRNDSRITSRWYPDFLSPGLFGVLHESGHAMYEQGTHSDFARTPLARGTSLGIHESQSRGIENIVGRSLPFWKRHYATLQDLYPAQLGSVSLDHFYRAINKVMPSYIRVEADELTYNFHIILRFELEQEMLNGTVAVKDLPEAWAAKMESLFGIVPPNDTQGCLQDVHWTRPGFGYFPTYALGNLYAAQFYATMREQNPQIGIDMNDGDPSSFVAWHAENIHQHGRKYPPQELVQRATGAVLSPQPFINYVTEKFTAIYGL